MSEMSETRKVIHKVVVLSFVELLRIESAGGYLVTSTDWAELNWLILKWNFILFAQNSKNKL